MIETERLRLCHWREGHFDDFADLHADPEVMVDLGGPIGRSASREKFARYRLAESEHGIARWAVEDRAGNFLGYAGVMPRMAADHPLGCHHEIGWRFKRSAWAKGYATESAKAALAHAIGSIGLTGILSYTSPDNVRSQEVMKRLGLVRRPVLDFAILLDNERVWRGLVWATP